jgi:hypothetical protein
VAACVVLVVLVGFGGWIWHVVRMGTSIEATMQRVERDVRAQFAARSADLQQLTHRLLAHPTLVPGLGGQERDVRALFDTVAEEASRAGPDIAVTVTSADGAAVAWAGRPQALDQTRSSNETAWFVGPGPLGLRLVYVEPVPAPAGDNGRATGAPLGAVAAEYLLSSQTGVDTSGPFPAPLRTPLVTVYLTPSYARAAYHDADDVRVVIETPAGAPLIDVRIPRQDVEAVRAQAQRQLIALMGLALAAATLVVAGVLGWERRRMPPRAYLAFTAGAVGAVAAARLMLWWALPSLTRAGAVTTSELYASGWLPSLHRSPADLMATAVAALALVALLAEPVRRLRLQTRERRSSPFATRQSLLTYVAVQLVVGTCAAGLALLCHALISDTVAHARTDMLDLAPYLGDLPRVVLQLGLIGTGAALFWMQVVVLRIGLLGWTHHAQPLWRRDLLPAGVWVLPVSLVAAGSWVGGRELPEVALIASVGASALVALAIARGLAWFRRGTQARRLLTTYVIVLLPALLMYPLLLDSVVRAKRRLVATQYAVEALNHPQELQNRLQRSLQQLDDMPQLAAIVSSAPRSAAGRQTDTALTLWRQTDLARYRLTSAVEIYAPDGPLLSRFALSFPEYEATVSQWSGTACTWDVFAEALPFGSEERPMMHAERAVCAVDPATGREQVVGGLILHVMLDYNALPFLSTQGPYFDLFRGREPQRRQDLPQRDVDLVLYGWGRSAIYSSAGRVWPLPDDVFDRAYASREAFWATQWRGDRLYDIHVSNDRLALYVVGYPRIQFLGHLVHLAELATLAAVGTVRAAAGHAARP